MKYLFIVILAVMLGSISCKLGKKPQRPNSVESYGNRQSILHQNQLEGNVNLDTLFMGERLFALGPVAGLQGEVTVYDDVVSIATIKKGMPHISSLKETEAIFLIKSNENDWVGHTIEKPLSSLDAVEQHVKALLISKDRDTALATPFRIETKVKHMVYHIIYKQDTVPHNKKEHQKAKVKFELKDTEINIIGFWVDNAREGKLTHPGKRTHLHFMTKNNETSGHIDEISIPTNAKIYFPSQ
ncbi:MAG: acetolactate decarboxylase [Bacteroidota bacterium]